MSQGAHGAVAITGGGSGLTYDPAGLYTGPDAFTYTISDGHGGSDTATVTVTVAPDATPPAVGSLKRSLPAQVIGTSTVKAALSWLGSDAGTGVASYRLERARRQRRVPPLDRPRVGPLQAASSRWRA